METFAARLRDRRGEDGTVPAGITELLADRRAFVALVDGGIPAPERLSGVAYRLHPGPLDAAPDELERLTAGDLVARFGPGA